MGVVALGLIQGDYEVPTIHLALLLALAASPDDREARPIREIMKIGAELQHAIRKHDIKGILKYVADYGISCQDDIIPKKTVAHDIKTPGTFANSYLFDAATFNSEYREYGDPMPISELLSKPGDVEMRVRFPSDGGSKDLNTPCLRFGPADLKNGPELCFTAHKGQPRWVLIDVLHRC